MQIQWKPYVRPLGDGTAVESQVFVQPGFEFELLVRIECMPRKAPMSATDAWNLRWKKIKRAIDDRDWPTMRYFQSMEYIEWLSNLGYHIELTGNEYTTVKLTLH